MDSRCLATFITIVLHYSSSTRSRQGEAARPLAGSRCTPHSSPGRAPQDPKALEATPGLCSLPKRTPRGDRPLLPGPISRTSKGGAAGPGPPVWASIGRQSRRSRGRTPNPPSTLPFKKNGGWAAAAANGTRGAEGRGAGE